MFYCQFVASRSRIKSRLPEETMIIIETPRFCRFEREIMVRWLSCSLGIVMNVGDKEASRPTVLSLEITPNKDCQT